jgi:hypothetical protein
VIILMAGKYIPMQGLRVAPQTGVPLPPSILACPVGTVYLNDIGPSSGLATSFPLGAVTATTYGVNTIRTDVAPYADNSDYNQVPMKPVFLLTTGGTCPGVAGEYRHITDFGNHPSDLVLLYDGNYMDAVDGPFTAENQATYEFRHLGGSGKNALGTASTVLPKGRCNILLSDCHVESFAASQLPHVTSFNSTGSFYSAAEAAAFGRPFWYCNEPR